MEYLRALYYPGNKGDLIFPLITAQQLNAMGEGPWRRLLIELGRELCTLIMLAGVGFMAGSNRREAWAHFMIAFGIWDIFYYVWLKLFLDWPASVMTWDLLFLVPVPWVSPVLAPVLISLTMIGAGLIVLQYEHRNCPVARFLDRVGSPHRRRDDDHCLVLLGFSEHHGRWPTRCLSMAPVLCRARRGAGNLCDRVAPGLQGVQDHEARGLLMPASRSRSRKSLFPLQCACEVSVRDRRKTLGGRTGADRGGGSKGVFGVVWGAFWGGNGQSYPFAVALPAPEGGEVAKSSLITGISFVVARISCWARTAP